VSRPPLVGRHTVSQWFTLAGATLAVATLVATALGVIAIVRLADARSTVLDRNGPAVLAQLQLEKALLDQENGVRGFALSGEPDFLAPYTGGRVQERQALAQLEDLLVDDDLAQARRDTSDVRSAAMLWRRDYAERVISAVERDGPESKALPSPETGRSEFAAVREALGRQSASLGRVRVAGRAHFANMADFLTVTFVAIVVLLTLAIAGTVIALRSTVTRPLRRVARQVQRTAHGEFDNPIAGTGPRDVTELAADVESMRRRIVEELSALQEAHARLDFQTGELQRSNTELEQFAYVASHDLQEPLRKIASFCQLLEQRYGTELDERGRQYIAFAVDGAKRMQQLINDLLAFSRVGRAGVASVVVDMNAVLEQARLGLATAIEETGAEIIAGPLPQVRGEPGLLAAVLQNLIGNAIKFHGGGTPHIEIAAARNGEGWTFTCADDGIGVEPEYADRIFMIFQRLHPKDVYAGTGIGLALCRKIVEYHGGRIWLDTDPGERTTFRFTLPALEETA
jgi:signal transduction histidine kinase